MSGLNSKGIPDLIRHIRGDATGHFPVWLMRQAGRYLPEYRKVREKHSFWEMATIPEVAAEITLQPTRRFPVDAAILFSDILTLPYSLKIPIEMREGAGPVIESPMRDADSFRIFDEFSAEIHTSFVLQAIRAVRSELAPERAVIGFAGAPWTVAYYLVAGAGKEAKEYLLKWLCSDSDSLWAALRSLGRATTAYLRAQIAAGADLVQLFDTWASEIPLGAFRTRYLSLLNSIFDEVRSTGVPATYFCKHSHHLLPSLADVRCDILGVDSLWPLKNFEQGLRGSQSLQGNLDPHVLFSDTSRVRKATRLLVNEARELERPAILNLGHGVLPHTPVENVVAFVDEARTPWL